MVLEWAKQKFPGGITMSGSEKDKKPSKNKKHGVPGRWAHRGKEGWFGNQN
jgi:hypothetical protein